MSELPEPDDATFHLATGEELVMPGEPPSDDVVAAEADAPDAIPPRRSASSIMEGISPSYRDRRTAGRLRARKVRRLVRHVEPWSVLKVSLLFYFCLWVILLIAGVLLWSFAVSSGTVDNIENFVGDLFALKSFEFNADEIFRASAIGGLVLVVAGSGFTVLMAVLFNLISDVTGGVRFTVVEEETARPRPKRTRPRHGTTVATGPGARVVPSATPMLATEEVAAPATEMPILPTAEESTVDESVS